MIGNERCFLMDSQNIYYGHLKEKYRRGEAIPTNINIKHFFDYEVQIS